MELKLKIKSVQVLIRDGKTDEIFLDLDYDVLAFPKIGQKGFAKIEVEHDLGIEFCKKISGLIPKSLILNHNKQ